MAMTLVVADGQLAANLARDVGTEGDSANDVVCLSMIMECVRADASAA